VGLPCQGAAFTIGAMRWLLHGNLTPAVADALRQRGDTPVDPATVGVAPDMPSSDVLKAAHKAQLDVMTGDAKLAEAPFADEAPRFGRSIVYFQLEGGDVEQDDAVTRLFERYKRLTPGRLYTVTGSRVKIRQLPGGR
jgi:hypothetical protein